MYPSSSARAGLSRRDVLLQSIACAAVGGVALPAHAQPRGVDFTAALRDQARGDRDMARFYEERGYRPLWVRGSRVGTEADQLIHLLESADADGLNARRYRPNALIEAIQETADGSPRSLARVEVLLSDRLADYVRDARRARDMGVIYTEEHFRPVVPTRAAVLAGAGAAPDLQAYLDGLGWMNPLYAQLRGAVASYRALEEGPEIHIPSGPVLRPGIRDPRVTLLRQRLGLAPGDAYDSAVASAVRELQRTHGQPGDGRAGPLTLALLNHGSREQLQLLRLNLERARAMPAQLGDRYILVDAAAARLWMYQNGEAVGTMRVAVGRPGEPTPMMAGMVRYVTLNPYWNVPPDLVRQRIAPGAARQGASFVRAGRYEVLSGWTNDARVVDPASVDWAAVAAGRGEPRVRQLPGPDNAMGRIKFMFPNEMGVYLHDTPNRALLRGEARLASAGCVRLDDAPRLARWLFGEMPRARGNAPEQRVNLPQPVPVYITYLTAAPEPQGVALRPDVYNRDPVQMAALGRRIRR